jgi:2-iminobutanoate/2-iminopropanoate deaminase
MPKEIIRTEKAPTLPLYSQGIRAGSHVFVSGMIGLDATTGQMAGDTIEEQTRKAVSNCAAVLAAGGASLDDVVEVGVLLTNPEDFAAMNEAYATVFPTDPPARYVAKLGVTLPNILVSIRMTAIVT